MRTSCFGSAGLLASAARPAELRGRVDIAFRHLIPPLLLPRCPELRRTARGADERQIFVVAALDKPWGTVAVVRGERCDIHTHDSRRARLVAPVRLASFAATDHRCESSLPAKPLCMLLACIADFVPDGLGPHPYVVDDFQRLTSVRDGTGRHEHSFGVVLPRHRRAADSAEPRLPTRVRLCPRCDVPFAADPPEAVVWNDEHRDAIASRGSAADRTMAHVNTGQFGVDLELNRAAIALASSHGMFLYAC